jgi:MFS transporter, SP family, arabinose:H+ symporter
MQKNSSVGNHAVISVDESGYVAGYLYLIAIVAAVGGFLFGFDMAIIAGSVPFLQRHFSLTAVQLGVAVSSVALGCVLGSSVAGFISDRFGRKKVLFLAAFLFMISSIWAAIPKLLLDFVFARFLSGVAIGLASPVSPVYIAEISPAKSRGGLVTLNQLAITFGMLAAYVTGWIFASMGTPEWRDMHAWRWMFACGAIPSAILLITLFLVPESPRFLAKQGMLDKAQAILTRIGGKMHAQEEMNDIQNALNIEQSSLWQLFRLPLRRPMVIGILLMVYSQTVGLQAVGYYCPKFLMELGFASEASAMLGMVAVGVALFLTTIVTMFVVDKYGRKPLLLLSSIGVIVSLLLLGAEFQFRIFPSYVMLAVILFAMIAYGIGIGPCSWLIVSEIFPIKVRGRATSICTFTLWAAEFLCLLLMPKLQEISQPGTFLMFACITCTGIIILWKITPETKGKTLEQIEAHWQH